MGGLLVVEFVFYVVISGVTLILTTIFFYNFLLEDDE